MTSVDPRTGAPFGPAFPDFTCAQVDAVVAEAVTAFEVWSSLAATGRAAALRAIADALEADGAALAELADAETGLGLPRLTGEVVRTAFQLRMFADAITARDRGRIDDPAVAGDPPNGHPALVRRLIPLGPVAVFGASNFPFAFSVLGGDTASALAAGCTVVAKAHPSHPQTSERVTAIARDALAAAGAPAAALGLVHGMDAGAWLVQHPSITAAGFTGSTAAGRALFDLAASRPVPIPFYGELGSVNPVVVTASAVDRPSLAAEYVASLTLGTGQFCTNPSLLLIPAGSTLVARIATALEAVSPTPLLNGGIARSLEANRSALAGIEGVTVMGAPVESSEGWFAGPSVLVTSAANAMAHRDLLTTECFGPVGVIAEYADEAELLALCRALDGCLVATLQADEDDAIVEPLVRVLMQRAGRLVWNGWPTGVAVTAGQHHGGPYPASTNALHTSVGTTAIRRFQRPIAFQSFPDRLVPR